MIDRFFKYEIKKNEENIRLWCKDVCYANIPLLENIFQMYFYLFLNTQCIA
jgi:hypothetical protein